MVWTAFKPNKERSQRKKYPEDTQFKDNSWFYGVEGAGYSGDVRKLTLQEDGEAVPYLQGLEKDNSFIVFDIYIEEEGMYDLNFHTYGVGGEKTNYLLVDDEEIAEIYSEPDVFSDSIARYVYLEKGRHSVKIEKFWGYIAVKGLEVMKTKPISQSTYNVDVQLVNPNATTEAKRLMQFLADNYGENIISGQTANDGHLSKEFQAISRETGGKTPAILSLDFIDESASRRDRLSPPDVLKHAETFHDMGGIVTFMWHWNAPDKYLYDSPGHPWWSGFYTEHTFIDLGKIMSGEDPEGYDLLVKEMDEIAVQLKDLQKQNIPILWRPLHEASGGWFWWGDSGSEPFVQLWKLMYDRYVNVHKLDNLIWVWNGQAKEWYPGDDYVDIIGEDIYPGKQVYGSQADRFAQAMDYTQAKKIIAYTENGVIPDPDLMIRDNIMWSYFTTWNGEFVINGLGRYSEEYTEKDMLQKVYSHKRVLTLDDLPDLSTYPLK